MPTPHDPTEASPSPSHEPIPAVVMGGSGYVAGELIRLLLAHPRFSLAAVASTSQVGEQVCASFPHLAGTAADALRFVSQGALVERLASGAPLALFAATPHGATAGLLAPILAAAEKQGAALRVVDMSADFRLADAAEYATLYGQPHAAPERLCDFVCAVPEHFVGVPLRHAAQPGCFTTAVTLAAYPFVALGLVDGPVFASAVTGSSGSGRKLGAGTHHPARHSTLFAYSALTHRHEAEMRLLLTRGRRGATSDAVHHAPVNAAVDHHATGHGALDHHAPAPAAAIEVEFVPHSGPFVRGIHATLRLTLAREVAAADLCLRVNAFYAKSPFVSASLESPKLTDVVGSNRCRLGIATRGRTLIVTSVIDNLIKGAAGGGVQWMNRMFGLADDVGLTSAGLGWY